jgi:hypothetical protein
VNSDYIEDSEVLSLLPPKGFLTEFVRYAVERT